MRAKQVFFTLLWSGIGLACLANGVIASGEVISGGALMLQAEHWPTTSGHIVKLRSEEHTHFQRHSKPSHYSKYFCSYSFSVDGKLYTSSRVSPLHDDNAALIGKNVGDELTIRYSPEDPSQSLVTTIEPLYPFTVFNAFFVLAFAATMFYFAWNRYDPTSPSSLGS